MDTSTQRVIATASLLTVGVGTLNSFYKNKQPPSVRFLIGSGAAYVILSALAEAEPEMAKALAFAVATTVILGDGGGVLSYINGKNETDTKKPGSNPKGNNDDDGPLASSVDSYPAVAGPFVPDTPSLGEFQEMGRYASSSSVTKIQPQVFRTDIVGYIPGY